MPKTANVPHELREFNKVFEKIASRHGWGEVYADFIDFSIACFSWEGNQDISNRLQRKYDSEYPHFSTLLAEWMKVQKSQLNTDTDWYDTLGTFYEIVSSRHKSSALGQFFTPPNLVTMMTLITGGKKGAKKRIQDCCAGSGRMLIAYHANYPGNYTFGADIDPICAKMTALNMSLHGCEGQAVCMDSLNPSDWRFGYRINPFIRLTGGIPHILPISQEQSLNWQYWEKQYNQPQPQLPSPIPIETPVSPPTPLQTLKVGKNGQLSFF